MARFGSIALLLLAVMACEGAPEMNVDQAGMSFDLTPSRPWRLEPPPSDTIQTVTRRIWYGDSADPSGAPSPDGRFLTHSDAVTGALAIRDLATGETRLLTEYRAPYDPGFALIPRFSRDGQRVAYSWRATSPLPGQGEFRGEFDLRVLGVDDAEPASLASSGWIETADWSPDGRFVLANWAAAEGTDMVLVSTRDGSVRVLEHFDGVGPGRMVFSPDGRFVLFDRPADRDDPHSRDIFALQVDGGRETPVVRHPADDFVLGWAPNGEYVLFGSDRTGTPGAWLQRVRDAQPQGGPLLVKPDVWGIRGLGFTDDGRFFYSVETGAREIHVANLDVETGRVVGAPEVLTPHAPGSQVQPSWSPDGRYVAYLLEQFRGSSTSNPPTLAIRSLDTGQERLLRLPPDVYQPREHYWLADGHSLVLRYTDEEMRGAIRRIDLRSGENEVVFRRSEGETRHVMITPDERAVVVYSWERSGDGRMETVLTVSDLESGEEREIFRAPAETASMTGFSSLSPDGSAVAAWHGKATGGGVRFLIVPLYGGDVREIPTPAETKLGSAVVWTPDQRFLVTTRLDDPDDPSNWVRHLVRVDIETGEVQELGLSGESLGFFRLSPDGRHLAYASGSEAYEVWVMEDFLPGGDGR